MDRITPCFAFSNNKDHLFLYIYAEFSEYKEDDISCDGYIFVFKQEGYFLKIKLPTQVCSDDVWKQNYNYDKDKQRYVFSLKKIPYDEELYDIDVITIYMMVDSKTVLNADKENQKRSNQDGEQDIDIELSKKLQNSKFFEESVPVYNNKAINTLSDTCDAFRGKCCFGSSEKNIFSNYEDAIKDIVDLPDVDSTDPEQRKLLREKDEYEQFDVEHYVADYFLQSHGMDECMISDAITYKPYWFKIDKTYDIIFDACEMDVLKNLDLFPVKFESEIHRHTALLSLVDILLGYAYDFRCTYGEYNSESAWNITKIASTFSWCQVFFSLDDVVVAFMRRSLCYPLFRNWRLSKLILEDVYRILKLGRRQIMKCLASLYLILNDDVKRFVFNDLYVTDYLIWVQSIDSNVIHSLATTFEKCLYVMKREVKFNLNEIEDKAVALLKQENKSEYDKWQRSLRKLISVIECKYKLTSNTDSSDSSDYGSDSY